MLLHRLLSHATLHLLATIPATGLACAAIIMDSKKALTLATVLMLSRCVVLKQIDTSALFNDGFPQQCTCSLLAGGFYVEELKSWMKWVNEASYLVRRT